MTQNLIPEIIDYLNSRYPKRPEYAKGVTFALISAISANSLKTDVATPVQTRSNIYSLLCGPSNSGKSTMVDYGLDLLDNAAFSNLITDDITAEAFAPYFSQHPYALMRMAEFSKVIGSYKRKNYAAGLRESLIKAYDGTPLTQNRSTRATNEARNYALSVIADTQPEVIAQEADETDVQSGLLPRYNWFHEPNPDKVTLKNMTEAEIVTREVTINRLKNLHKIALNREIRFKFNNQQLRNIDDKLKEFQKVEHFHLRPFYERTTMFVFKYAMLHQFADPSFISKIEDSTGVKEEENEWDTDQTTLSRRETLKLAISNESVEWSIAFNQDYLINSLPKTIAILRLSDADKIVDAITSYKNNHHSPIPESLLYRSVLHALKEARRIQNAIELALKMDLITRQKVQGGIRYMLFVDGFVKPVDEYEDKEAPAAEEIDTSKSDWDDE